MIYLKNNKNINKYIMNKSKKNIKNQKLEIMFDQTFQLSSNFFLLVKN